ncbi:glycosyltransferase [Methylorubrum suomiense]|uniref:O-mycaminosyltylonolide 6-deoxyallosyltransferase n=1 Tax=Methylorubrum suomiense TaxID=144191 RepID=A0ABQ4V0A4_9HYPH|nr:MULTISPECIES: glycosyltransferase [Methylobacteriaceae]GJE76357.1 O-mycaminosyltylonolide 6-deoxyallosyltransferase [Methylorubrum suomiense]
MIGRIPRTVIITFGTGDDLPPFCILGQALVERGHEVRVVTTRDPHGRIRASGLEPIEAGDGFRQVLDDPRFEPIRRTEPAALLANLPLLGALRRALQDRLTALIETSLIEMRGADIVVFDPLAFFVGPLAREAGLPAVRVMRHPMLPTRTMSAALFGGHDRGRIENRLSYEAFRLLSWFGRRSFAEIRRRHGGHSSASAFGNPMTADLAGLHHVAAWSPVLSPDPGDWPVPVLMTGFWQASPHPDARLPDPIEAFLAAGPPPIYVDLRPMGWGAESRRAVIESALERWGGRAILRTAPGEFTPPLRPSPNLAWSEAIDPPLLLPRTAAAVHHGDPSTLAAALRAGRPSVILPQWGDQVFWGRRVADLGASEVPVPLRQVGAEDLAGRISRAVSDPGLAEAAAAVAQRLTGDPGVSLAAARIDALARAQLRDRPIPAA